MKSVRRGRQAGPFAVVAGVPFANKVGAAVFGGLTITANILMSLAVDPFGLFGMEQHSLNLGRIAGGALVVAAIALTCIF